MQRMELRRAVTDRFGITDTGDALLTPSVINGLIDQGLRAYAREKINWPWLLTESTVTLTTGTATLPLRFLRARTLLVGTAPNLNPVRQVRIDEFQGTMQWGHRWCIVGTAIRVLPIPTAALTATFRYYASETPLANDTTEPVMPEAYQQVLVDYASHLAAMVRQDDRRAQQYLDLYTRGVKDMAAGVQQSANPRRVRVRDDDEQFNYGTWT